MNYDTTFNPTYNHQLTNNNVHQKDMYFQTTPMPSNVTMDTNAGYTINNTTLTNMSSPSIENIDKDLQQRNVMIEKRKKRREAHNAVERRRRDNINARIIELSTLLPEKDTSKNNKGTILRKSVDHIRLLQDTVNQYQDRVQELENELQMYRMRWGTNLPGAGDNGTTSTTNTPTTDFIPPYYQQQHRDI